MEIRIRSADRKCSRWLKTCVCGQGEVSGEWEGGWSDGVYGGGEVGECRDGFGGDGECACGGRGGEVAGGGRGGFYESYWELEGFGLGAVWGGVGGIPGGSEGGRGGLIWIRSDQ